MSKKGVFVGMLKISEIFYSLQGEGHNAGMPAIFVRLSGCNKRCGWCDTNYHVKGRSCSKSAVLAEIRALKTGCQTVILTGGEPCMQDILVLVQELRKMGYYIAIETNGSIKIDTTYIDWITVSPKDKKIALRSCSECKVVWTG